MDEKMEALFDEDGPASAAARRACDAAVESFQDQARLGSITVGYLIAYGVLGACLYHKALLESAESGRGGED
ncbi:hypothetical protein [Adlercreutzia equolifaciens]|uniref:hypothetical protein n=1 Tax=Adlercreutzia equolifaciens TaxID=446660 RepID=UPI003521B3BA